MVTYRKAERKDIDMLLKMRGEFLIDFDGDDYLNNKEKLDKSIKNFLDRSVGEDFFSMFIAEDKGETIATSAIVYYEVFPAVHYPNGKIGLVMSVYTKPEYRGQGVGKKIFNMAFEEAKKRDCVKIVLNATEQGEKIYNKFNFIKENTEMIYFNKEVK